MDPLVVERMVKEIEAKDASTAAHTWRVVLYLRAMLEERGVRGDELLLATHAAALHDVGKLDIPAEILQKPSRLTSSLLKRSKVSLKASRCMTPTIAWSSATAGTGTFTMSVATCWCLVRSLKITFENRPIAGRSQRLLDARKSGSRNEFGSTRTRKASIASDSVTAAGWKCQSEKRGTVASLA